MKKSKIIFEYFINSWSEDLVLKLLVLLSVFTVVCEYLPIHFHRLSKYYDTINALAIGYIISYFFYFMNIKFSEVKEKVFIYFKVLQLLYCHFRFFILLSNYIENRIKINHERKNKLRFYKIFKNFKSGNDRDELLRGFNHNFGYKYTEYELKNPDFIKNVDSCSLDISINPVIFLKTKFSKLLLELDNDNSLLDEVIDDFKFESNREYYNKILESYKELIKSSNKLKDKSDIFIKYLSFKNIKRIDEIVAFNLSTNVKDKIEIRTILKKIIYAHKDENIFQNYIEIYNSLIPTLNFFDLFTPLVDNSLIFYYEIHKYAFRNKRKKAGLINQIIKNNYSYLTNKFVYISNRDKNRLAKMKSFNDNKISILYSDNDKLEEISYNNISRIVYSGYDLNKSDYKIIINEN